MCYFGLYRIKDISRFNSGSVTSLDKEAGFRIPSRPSSGYSDFGEKKALFEHKDEEIKTSKIPMKRIAKTDSPGPGVSVSPLEPVEILGYSMKNCFF